MNSLLQELTRPIELAADTLHTQDAEIREIYIEEVEDIIQLLNANVPQWMTHAEDRDLLTTIRRSFHTLKGSGRMVGATSSAELAWSIEELLNRVIAGQVQVTSRLQGLVFSVVTLYQEVLINDYRQAHQDSPGTQLHAIHALDFRPFILAAQRLRDHQPLEPLLQWTITYHASQHIPTAAELDAGVGSTAIEHDISTATEIIALPTDTPVFNTENHQEEADSTAAKSTAAKPTEADSTDTHTIAERFTIKPEMIVANQTRARGNGITTVQPTNDSLDHTPEPDFTTEIIIPTATTTLDSLSEQPRLDTVATTAIAAVDSSASGGQQDRPKATIDTDDASATGIVSATTASAAASTTLTNQVENSTDMVAKSAELDSATVGQQVISAEDAQDDDTLLFIKQTLAIFIEETDEHLDTILRFLQLDEEPTVEHFNQLIRAIHTIRGSSGMVGLGSIFSASTHIENLFKLIEPDHYVDLVAEHQLLLHYYDYLKVYTALLGKDECDKDQLNTLDAEFQVKWAEYEQHNDHLIADSSIQGLVAKLLDLDIHDLLDAEFAFVQTVQTRQQPYLEHLVQQAQHLLNFKYNKQTEHIHVVTAQLQRCYTALIEHQSAQNNADLLTQVQVLHHYLIDIFDGMASGQNVVISPLAMEEFEHVIQAINHSSSLDESVNSKTTHIQLEQSSGLEQSYSEQPDKLSVHPTFDPIVFDIFLEEAEELSAAMDSDFEIWRAAPHYTQAVKNMLRHLHTLKGGANMVRATHLGDIAHELENIYERIIKGVLASDPQLMATIRQAQDHIAHRLQRLRHEQIDEADHALLSHLRTISDGKFVAHSVSATNGLIATDTGTLANNSQCSESDASYQALNDASSAHPQFDHDLLQVFLEESDELIVGMERDFEQWQRHPEQSNTLKHLLRHLHTLKGGANMLQATHLGTVAHELETIYERLLKGLLHPTGEAIDIIRTAQDNIAHRIQVLREQQIDAADPQLISKLKAVAQGQGLAHSTLNDAEMATYGSVSNPTDGSEIVAETEHLAETESTADFIYDIDHAPLLVEAMQQADPSTLEQIQNYLEDAAELIIQGEQGFDEWRHDRSNRKLLLILQRNYHSLKGNSRQVNQPLIADIAYQLELIFTQFSQQQLILSRYDALIQQAQQWLKFAIFKSKVEGAAELKAQLQALQVHDQYSKTSGLSNRSVVDFNTIEQYEFVQGDGAVPPSMYPVANTAPTTNSQEYIRISADLVEKMIDLSGENAINRSRIEMDLGQMSFTLSEMELAIHRLADQLRRMEGELETQILTRHEVSGQRYEDFDLLEMDQYSALNQLSKSLSESASDLIDFKTTLADKLRGTESLLLQQSRIQNELQQKLMGTRLVPFSRMVPRLQRLVRQISTQLNRPIEFDIQNTEGELDRHILERLINPLEHMLRNAIDHGIEDQETRLQNCKSATGHISLNVAREGNDIVVSLSDDGQGIDVAAVKQKAIQNHLLSAQTSLSDEEVMQYIFHSGLSTARHVTQISGRGVGLDVVQNDIKALGGHVTVQSIVGQGTRFVIRVPTSVAVADALMVKVGDSQYALPLAHIKRIVRVSPIALNEYYDSQSESLTIDQVAYRLRYMGEFIEGQARPQFAQQAMTVPVIIFNSGGRSVAIQVDQLIGSRLQVVIKPIGQQMGTVGSLAGATILADGRVALILDGQAIARRALSTDRPNEIHSQQIVKPTQAPDGRSARRLIMVVDDSVTVRKVTSRLLERQGFDVVTANDGIDAMEKLATIKPDLMLLDIEMPRMDGFEVATFVRHESQQKQLPIIMITSRTGEKHREHALSLEVNAYMGKPFQEDELMTTIQQLLKLDTVS